MSVAEYLKDIVVNPDKYAKFYIALATAVLNLLTVSYPNQPWLPVVINFAGAFGVFMVPNKK
jgi:hypothetical protein